MRHAESSQRSSGERLRAVPKSVSQCATDCVTASVPSAEIAGLFVVLAIRISHGSFQMSWGSSRTLA